MSNRIKYLVFSGGGAMGAGYAGALRALTESQQIDSIRAVAGSSVGSICSALIATGIEPQKYQDLTKETNIGQLLGKGFIHKEAKPLYNLIRQTIHENILNYMDHYNLELACEARILEISEEKSQSLSQLQDLATQINNTSIEENNEEQQENLKILRIDFEELNYKIQELDKQFQMIQSELNSDLEGIAILKSKCQGDGKITFRDLDLLRAIDPKRFKSLIITAVRQDNGNLNLFSADTTPDVEIAKACQASSAIPLVFKHVEIDGIKYVDGGYRDNIPMNHFNSNIDPGEFKDITDSKLSAHKRGTLIFAFAAEENGTTITAIYSGKAKIYNPNRIMRFFIDVLLKFIARVGGNFKYTDTKKQTLSNLRDNALSTIPLPTNVRVLDFDKATQRSDYLMLKSQLQTQRHFNNHGVGECDNRVELKELFLAVYEDLKFKKKSWKISVKLKDETKVDDLLMFAKSEQFNNRTHEDICKAFILNTCFNKKRNFLDINTEATKILIEKLNSPECPDEVKQKFMSSLHIKDDDRRFSYEKSFGKNIVDFQFIKEDFEHLIQKNRHLSVSSSMNRDPNP